MNIMTLADGDVLVVVPVQFKTILGRRRIEVAGKGEVSDVDRDETGIILQAFARAYAWTRMLEERYYSDITSFANELGVDRARVVKTLRLANLSPRIVRAVITHQLPDDFSLERLYWIKSDSWAEQENEIGLTRH